MILNPTSFQSALTPAAFWRPDTYVKSAWTQHVPFAFWLISVFQPRRLVELGTHRGMSYLSFCQAIKRIGIRSEAYAVDHWKGDEHAGYYGRSVFEKLKGMHDPQFSEFSTLLRMDFDSAANRFTEQSVDLLHIDGLHTYEAVKHDFEVWRPKLANPAIVLFHDTCVFDRGFGVHRLWSELSRNFRSFGFHHGYGLGVLGVGHDFTQYPEIEALFDASSREDDAQFARLIFEELGERLTLRHRITSSTVQIVAKATSIVSSIGSKVARISSR